jgi:hypothetical protein
LPQQPQPVAEVPGPPTVPQPALGAPEPAPLARPRFEASQIDPRDPLGLGLVEPVLPSVDAPQPPRGAETRAPQPQQPAAGHQQFAPQQAQPALPPRSPEHGQPLGEDPAFRSGGASRMASVQVNQPGPDQSQQGRQRAYQPQRPGTSAPGHPLPGTGAPEQQPYGNRPAQEQPYGGGPAQQQPHGSRPVQEQQPQREAGEAPWRSSANDERWRRAEQLRTPSSDGVTLSGLPRRTPQANLVAGTAESSPLSGPQVSRAPEEVRGRLTNLRRGIQQGRRAGSESGQPTGQFPAAGGRFDGIGGPGGDVSANGGYRSPAPEGNDFGQPGDHGFGNQNQER